MLHAIQTTSLIASHYEHLKSSNAGHTNIFAANVSANTSLSPPIDDVKQINATVSRVNEQLSMGNSSLYFSVNNESGKTVVKLIDANTGELIRQTPTEAALVISARIELLMNKTSGALFEAEA